MANMASQRPKMDPRHIIPYLDYGTRWDVAIYEAKANRDPNRKTKEGYFLGGHGEYHSRKEQEIKKREHEAEFFVWCTCAECQRLPGSEWLRTRAVGDPLPQEYMKGENCLIAERLKNPKWDKKVKSNEPEHVSRGGPIWLAGQYEWHGGRQKRRNWFNGSIKVLPQDPSGNHDLPVPNPPGRVRAITIMDKVKQIGNDNLGNGIVNRRIKVYWAVMGEWYTGQVAGFDPETKRHRVDYDDGQREIKLYLGRELYKFIEDGLVAPVQREQQQVENRVEEAPVQREQQQVENRVEETPVQREEQQVENGVEEGVIQPSLSEGAHSVLAGMLRLRMERGEVPRPPPPPPPPSQTVPASSSIRQTPRPQDVNTETAQVPTSVSAPHPSPSVQATTAVVQSIQRHQAAPAIPPTQAPPPPPAIQLPQAAPAIQPTQAPPPIAVPEVAQPVPNIGLERYNAWFDRIVKDLAFANNVEPSLREYCKWFGERVERGGDFAHAVYALFSIAPEMPSFEWLACLRRIYPQSIIAAA